MQARTLGTLSLIAGLTAGLLFLPAGPVAETTRADDTVDLAPTDAANPAPIDPAVTSPDLKISGWSVFDLVGNLDGGLHPGETAQLAIQLTNQGNATARNISGTLSEVRDHPDVTIVDKFALFFDAEANGFAAPTLSPDFLIEVAPTRPCRWEIPLRLELTADGGYYASLEFTLEMVDPRITDLALGRDRFVVWGASPGDILGSEVATGDLDGDGLDELIVAAQLADGAGNLRPDAGEVVVVWGRRPRCRIHVSSTSAPPRSRSSTEPTRETSWGQPSPRATSTATASTSYCWVRRVRRARATRSVPRERS